MKKRELIELNAVLNQLKEFGGTKFKYSILKNITEKTFLVKIWVILR